MYLVMNVACVFHLVLTLSPLLVILKIYSVVTILQLIGSRPFCRKWASLSCYTGNISVIFAKVHLEPLIFIIFGG